MSRIRIFVMTAIGLLPLASIAQESAPPPVVTPEHAICVGRQYFERRAPSLGKFSCEAKEHGKLWTVRCTTESSTVRGGGGELEVDSVSGKVKLVLGYR
jgi:hypothetical protein